ncbi:MAG: SPFH domain-containing protein [Candidatus Korarchaeota archaeon]
MLFEFLESNINWILIFLITLITVYIIAKSFFEYLNPYEAGIKQRYGRLQSKIYYGGIVPVIPFIDRVIRVDTRHRIMWCAFWGDRGSKTQIRRIHDEFYEKARELSRIHTSIKFEENDFQNFGPLITEDGVILNAVVGVFYRIEDPYKLIVSIGSQGYKPALASKLSSSLRAVIASMSLNEIFEQRTILVEKTRKETDDVAAQWGIDVISVTLEELFLEDPELQNSLDQKRFEEIKGGVKVMMATKDKEVTRIKRENEALVEMIKLKASNELKKIEAETKKAIAEIEVEKQKLLATLTRYEAEVDAEIRRAWAEAEAEVMNTQERLVTPELIKYEALTRLRDTISNIKNIVIIPTDVAGGNSAAIILPYLLSSGAPGLGINLSESSTATSAGEEKKTVGGEK